MKELVMENQDLVEILDKICIRQRRIISEEEKGKLYYENFRRGTYFATILTIDDEIVGIGMTKKYKYDYENPIVAQKVAFAKAIRDYWGISMPQRNNPKGSFYTMLT